MRRRLFTVMLLLLLPTLVAGVASAQDAGVQALPGGSWTTGTQVQNVGTGPATIIMTVYGQTSGQWNLTNTDVAAGSSVNFSAASFGWTDGSMGSAVVESDQPIVATTNETNGIAAGQYQGIDAPNGTLKFPLVKNNYQGSGKSTTFFVQNAGSSPAVISAVYKDVSGATYNWNSGAPVQPSRMVMLNPTDVGFPTDKLGSLTVTAGVPIAGVVNEHHVSDGSILQAARGFAPADAGQVLLIPTIKRQHGNCAASGCRSTGPIIQNVSGGAVNVTISYKGTGINFVQYANNMPNGSSVVFYENAIVCPAGATCGSTGTPLPANTLCSAVVEATGDIVGVVNESYFTVPPGQRQRATATAAFDQVAATIKVAIPQYKVNHDYKNSGIQLQNTDLSNSATFDAVFAMGSGGSVTEYTLHGSINPGQAVTLFKLYSALPPGASWVGAGFPAGWSASSTAAQRLGSVTITSNRAIVAAVTESDEDPDVNARQDIKSYEGFNLAP